MIIYNPKDWFGLIFQFHKSDTFRRLIWVIICLAIFHLLVIFLTKNYFPGMMSLSPTLHTLLGLVISLSLVFRTNTAYDRWWEGRKLWGALVNVSRNFALKVNAFVPGYEVIRRTRISMLAGSYAGVLKEHLRDSDRDTIIAQVPEFFRSGIPATVHHIPNYLANYIQSSLLDMFQRREVSEASYLSMLNDLNQFTDICGACERIKNTPIPYTYNIFIKKFIFIYVITLPFTFAAMAYDSVIITILVFYAFASLELIAEEIEDPFGIDANDLPTDALAANIYRNVEEIMKIGSGA